MKQRILVVDDSPFVRRVISDWIKSEADMELIGTASNGEEAVRMVLEHQPDVVTLDVEMPIRDGLSALEEIMRKHPTAVVMVSSVTTQGAQSTLKALELGALDFVTKPQGSSSLKVLSCRAELLQKIRSAKSARLIGNAFKATTTQSMAKTVTDKVVVIAASTGGPKALAQLWQTLPKGFPAAILIVQHMPAGFTDSFARRLDGIGTVPCKEAAPGDRLVPGLALLAPGGHHMILNSTNTIEINQDPPLHGTRPAADPLFFSAVKFHGTKIVGAVLTGMGRDGAEGAKAIIQAGGVVYGECESSCVIYGMPKAAFQAGGITSEHPIGEIGNKLVQAIQGKIARAS